MPGWHIVRGDGRLELVGELGFADAAAIWRAMGDATAGIGLPRDPPDPQDPAAEPALVIDLGRASRVDGAVVALVVAVRARLVARGVRCHITAGTEQLRALVHLYRGDEPPPPAPVQRGRERGIARLGGAVDHALGQARQMVGFSGELAAAIAATIRRPARASWRDLPALIIRAGTDGIPIVLVLNFLIGFVMAYQSARQLALFGANIYAADIVGLSVPRELAPLMTAIIVVGRSGAAYAAELGTMRVSDEIDALRTMGFAPVPYLVVPRILALVVVAPVLTLLGDVVGVIGGLVVGSASLAITPAAFLAELRTAVESSDVWTGLVKSIAFGAAIGVIGCKHGLATRGAASGVGRGTTRTVVSCLFTIVVIDTLFTMAFRRLGL